VLTLEPATRPVVPRHRIGLALAGGGPLGAYYEIGALHALSESIDGLDLSQLHSYVGVSSGSVLAACLANRIDTVELARLFITSESARFPVAPGVLFQPAFTEYLERALRLPGAVLGALSQYARHPLSAEMLGMLVPVSRSIPAGIFDNAPLEHLVADLLGVAGRSNDFRRLEHALFVVATDLDSGDGTVFGRPGFQDVPISRAVQASTALPGLYKPVTIGGHRYVDGALKRTMHASLALERGDDLVFCLNPLVTFAARMDLARQGMPTVLSQTFRALIQSRMQVSMADYPQRYPHSDILLFEPDRNDDRMFFLNVFKYGDRQRLTEHAYQRTRSDLRKAGPRLERILRRHGLALRHDVLRDRRRSLTGFLATHRRSGRRVLADLDRTLNRLRQSLGAG
jgi:predicted acylesterase/phospholipase RssA